MKNKILRITILSFAFLTATLTFFTSSNGNNSDVRFLVISKMNHAFANSESNSCIGKSSKYKKGTTGDACYCYGNLIYPVDCDRSGKGCTPLNCSED